MDASQLATLRAVRDRGGVGAAAASLHLTPSAVSQQLKALSRAAGVPVTERVGRGVRLTPAGTALATAADDVALALARAEAACDEFQARPSGTVGVAAFQSASQMLLPGLLSWAAARPEIDLTVADEDVAQAEFPSLTLDHDIVVAHRPDPADAHRSDLAGAHRAGLPHGRGRGGAWPSGLVVEELLREPLDVALPLDHRLAGRDRVSPEDLRGEAWIAVRTGFPVAAVLDAVGRSAGEQPSVVHRINDFHVVEALVAAGHGISLLPRYTADHRDGTRFRLVPLAGIAAGRRIEALMRPDRATRTVVGAVLEALRVVARGIVEPD